MSQTPAAAPSGPATYDRLKALRGNYALTILGVLVVSWCMSGAVQMFPINVNARQPTEHFISPVMLTTLYILPALSGAIVTGIYASKVGMPYPVVPAILAPWPLLQWVAFFMVVGYTPEHLRESEPPEKPPPVATWLIVGFLPVALMGLLSVLNPNYVSQLFLGPPIGVNIPGLPIPCGWPILAMVFLGILLSNASLWLGIQKGLVRGRWKMLLTVLVLLFFTFPSLWLVLLGPAAIQAYNQFFPHH